MRIYLRILTKSRMKTLQLNQRIVVKFYFFISLLRRVEVVVVNNTSNTSNSIYTSNSLHKSCCIPRRVIVYNYIGSMKVYTFCQNIGSDDDIVIILFLTNIVGIKVFLYGFKNLASVIARNI